VNHAPNEVAPAFSGAKFKPSAAFDMNPREDEDYCHQRTNTLEHFCRLNVGDRLDGRDWEYLFDCRKSPDLVSAFLEDKVAVVVGLVGPADCVTGSASNAVSP